jgi:hypothetical protein
VHAGEPLRNAYLRALSAPNAACRQKNRSFGPIKRFFW